MTPDQSTSASPREPDNAVEAVAAHEAAGTVEQEYSAARTGSVMIDASARGRLRFTGKNRVDFLHRMSTNDLLELAIGQGAGTVFTTPIARIIDRTVVYVREGDVLMLTSRGNQSRVRQWLRKYIFFNDDVQIKDVTDETEMISVYGATANQVILQMTGEDLSVLPLHHWRAAQIAGGAAESAQMPARAAMKRTRVDGMTPAPYAGTNRIRFNGFAGTTGVSGPAGPPQGLCMEMLTRPFWACATFWQKGFRIHS